MESIGLTSLMDVNDSNPSLSYVFKFPNRNSTFGFDTRIVQLGLREPSAASPFPSLICGGLEVQDIRVVRDLLQKRGNYSDVRVRATVGNNRHWLIHVFDPDGSRSEIMEAGLQNDLPAGTIMAPGAPAPPILPPAKKDAASAPKVQ